MTVQSLKGYSTSSGQLEFVSDANGPTHLRLPSGDMMKSHLERHKEGEGKREKEWMREERRKKPKPVK